MAHTVSLLDLSSNMARHAATRHSLISQNIANADTPGYKAQDVADFSAVMESQKLSGTDAGINPLEALDRPSVGSPNGNTVSLEDELMRGSKAQQDHELAVSIYRSTLTMMKTAVGKNL
ncbi:flagellar biosynthesis protein FlgB [Algimonas arctica]|uniref:Flagellar biosynthesis protein FlgB n=1 Tax=Algimonas arctica TaxID=1479486 RepID=A0A8J3CPV6_9PROT|nr:flagellar basal body protein [Algimonas arctica]GHA89334.1 flagellar biosynthesis protein FlgB [Algimonas arctica]